MEKKVEKGIKILLCVLIAVVAIDVLVRVFSYRSVKQEILDMYLPNLEMMQDKLYESLEDLE